MELAQNLFSSRRNSLLIGAGAAALAAIIVGVYLYHYRNTVNGGAAPATALVAKSLIQKGTPGDVVGTRDLFQVISIPKSELKAGAISDPATLQGRIALSDIYPNQQLTAADFSPVPVDALVNNISGIERAISVPIAGPNSVNGQLAQGDHIDIFVGMNFDGPGGGKPIIKLVMKDMLVLRPPLGGVATLRATEQQAAALAWAADNGRLWFVLRPPSGAVTPKVPIVTASTLLSLKPVR